MREEFEAARELGALHVVTMSLRDATKGTKASKSYSQAPIGGCSWISSADSNGQWADLLAGSRSAPWKIESSSARLTMRPRLG